MATTQVRIALIDLYEGMANEGIRAITESVQWLRSGRPDLDITFDRFDTRTDGTVPGLDYDIYISSGGPGSPFDGEGEEWESNYFDWVENVWQHNQATASTGDVSKHILFICHSFQLMCRHFELATVNERSSPSFGILKVHQTPAGLRDSLFSGLPDPFYAADFRAYQVVEPRVDRLEELGAEIIAMEKNRPHVSFERAVMGIRISSEIVGVQFHPEADPPGMKKHFQTPKRKKATIEQHSQEKYEQVMQRLDDPDFLERTHRAILPNFYAQALVDITRQLRETPVG